MDCCGLRQSSSKKREVTHVCHHCLSHTWNLVLLVLGGNDVYPDCTTDVAWRYQQRVKVESPLQVVIDVEIVIYPRAQGHLLHAPLTRADGYFTAPPPAINVTDIKIVIKV